MSQHQAEIHKQLWSIANTLRAGSAMEPTEFKNYILGIIFYKFLSEKVEDAATELLKHDNVTYTEAWENEETRNLLEEELVTNEGYFIEPQYLFSTLVTEISKGSEGKFDTELLQAAINQIMRSTRGSESEDDFDNLFDGMDLSSKNLGKDVKTRSGFMAKILNSIHDISFRHEDVEIDVLGDAYEYMISNFAATAGKKAGEFYTPQQVSKILAKIVANGKTKLKNVYDPTCGSGSLLLRVSNEAEVSKYYGQELSPTTYNLARMNMMLHGVPYNRFDIRNGNTLTEDMHEDKTFEAIVANPPYGLPWSPTAETIQDDRFSDYGKLAPESKADFAFVQHMLHHLDDQGTMAVVLSNGILFRGAVEGSIRKKIIENNYIHAVIGLPANIFFGTTIASVILVFKKNRQEGEGILFIDALNEFKKEKNKNILTNDHVKKIVDTYTQRATIDKYSKLVGLEEIISNDFNLNIPRYIDVSEQEEVIDLEKITSDLLKEDKNILILNLKKEILFRELDPAYKTQKVSQDEVLKRLNKLPQKSMNSDAPMNSIIINIWQNSVFDERLHFSMKGGIKDLPAVNRGYDNPGNIATYILASDIKTNDSTKLFALSKLALEEKLNLTFATHDINFHEEFNSFSVSFSSGFGEKHD